MSALLKVLKNISRVFLYIGYAAILALACMTVFDVIMRYFFGKPTSGVTEWSQMFLIISMTTLAHALIEGRFISVGVLVDRFPKRVNIAFEILMGVMSFLFFVIVGWQLIAQVGVSMKFKETYFVIKTPRWPLYGVLGASFILSALATVVYVIERITKFKAPKDKDVFDDNPDLAILAFMEENDKKEEGAE